MNVLVTNDDGIGALGIGALVEALSGRGHRIYVVAPSGNQSGVGKAVKLPAGLRRVSIPGAVEAWSIDSTPATAVLVAILHILAVRPDLVVSGVNKGPNMGLDDILTSGTVGAALEAAIHGIPAVAVSLATDSGSPEAYMRAAQIGVGVGEVLARFRTPVVANVNVPEEEPLGVRITKPARNSYRLRLTVSSGVIDHERLGYRARYWDTRPGTDVEAVLTGHVSVTLLDPEGIYAGDATARTLEPRIKEAVEAVMRVRPQRNNTFPNSR